MNRILCWIFLFVAHQSGAQFVNISVPTKLPRDVTKFKILGKNNDGCIVRFSGKSDLLHIYNQDLKLKTTKTFEFKNQAGDLQYIWLRKSGAAVFFLVKEKQQAILFAQPVNATFNEIGNPIPIDTFDNSSGLAIENLRMKTSMDQRFLVFYFPVFGKNTIAQMQLSCVDPSLQLIYKTFLPINRPEKDMEYAKALIDNKGNSYFIFSAEKNGKDISKGDALTCIKYDATTKENTPFPLVSEEEIFSEPLLEIDNKNNQLVFTGFYDNIGNVGDPVASGVFFKRYDLTNGALQTSEFSPFSNEFIKDLTGRDGGFNGNKLFTFSIRKIALREDGGAFILAESFLKDTRDAIVNVGSPMNMSMGGMSMGGFGGYGQQSVRTMNTYQYNDVIGFSVLKTGKLDWHQVLKKKQYSEDDNGVNSSFCTLNTKDKMHLLYLDDISFTGQLIDQDVSSDGVKEKRILFDQSDKDIFLFPKNGKQITAKEVAIPSLKNGMFRLVTVRY